MWHYYDSLKSMMKPANESKLLMGIVMIVLNVCSKYIEMGFSKTQEHALRNNLGREILIFAITFTATKDLIISILITAAFVILSDFLLHEDSRFCLMPERMKKLSKLVDLNKDGVISKEEEERAIKILEKANNETLNNKSKNIESFQNQNMRYM